MSPIAASIAARVRGPMPRGFSLDASLTMVRSSRPISRASSEIGLPGWYGAIERTYEGDSSQGSMSISVCCRVGPQHLQVGREQRVHGAGLVLGRQDERCAVAAGRPRLEIAEHEEPGRVVRIVLDRAREH